VRIYCFFILLFFDSYLRYSLSCGSLFQIAHDQAYEWNHSVGSIVNALIQASIQIEFIHEHAFGFWKCFSTLEKDENGKYWFPNKEIKVPLMLSVKGIKRSNI
jgi:hypothetical protein